MIPSHDENKSSSVYDKYMDEDRSEEIARLVEKCHKKVMKLWKQFLRRNGIKDWE